MVCIYGTNSVAFIETKERMLWDKCARVLLQSAYCFIPPSPTTPDPLAYIK
jgi:hypothetical protein